LTPRVRQRGAFTTPCPRRNAAPRPLVYKSRKLPRRGVPTGAGRPGAIAATRPGISAGARLGGGSRQGGDCAWAGDPGGEVTNSGARRRSGTRDEPATDVEERTIIDPARRRGPRSDARTNW